jgi:RecA-family ATPase
VGDDGRSDAPGGDFSLETLDIVDPTTLDGREVPERRWIWRGWIPVGAVTALYGDGGAGKSLLAQELMTACATGETFLGEDVTPCRVLGVFCEDDGDELHRRQDALNKAVRTGFGDLERMRWISRVGNENLLMTFGADGRGSPTPFFRQVVEAAKRLQARVVVIDTAADTFAGNENVRPQVRQFIALLTRLAREVDGSVILLAHPSQLGKTTGSGEGGSTAWNNSVRSRLYLKRLDGQNGEGSDPNFRILARVKANYASIGEEIELRYEDGAFIRTSDVRPAEPGVHPNRAREAEDAVMDGLQVLNEKHIRCNVHRGQANYAPKALREKSNAGTRFSEEELAFAMNRLIKEGRIESVEEGPPSRRRSYLKVIAPHLPGV